MLNIILLEVQVLYKAQNRDVISMKNILTAPGLRAVCRSLFGGGAALTPLHSPDGPFESDLT